MEASRNSRPRIPEKHLAWIAFVWGLAEATLFFIVPDVLITRLALRRAFRPTVIVCMAALAGATIGGTALWRAANYTNAPTFVRIFKHLPGINRDVIAETGIALQEGGPKAFFTGASRGEPYKLFAFHSGMQQLPLVTFLLVSISAHLVRFTLAAMLAWMIGHALKRWSDSGLVLLHTIVWLCFYVSHFLTLG